MKPDIDPGVTQISLNDLTAGSTWVTGSGSRFTVMDRGFIAMGRRWVSVWVHDFEQPYVYDVDSLQLLRTRPLRPKEAHDG